jgi:thiol-disulfide isomerase/thioredoxin
VNISLINSWVGYSMLGRSIAAFILFASLSCACVAAPFNSMGATLLADRTTIVESAEKRLTLMQFWASWCHSCGGLMADLQKVTRSHAAIERIAVSVDVLESDARQALRSRLDRFDFVFYHDANQKLADYYSAESVPTIVLLSPEGVELFRHEGHATSAVLLSLDHAIAGYREKQK